MTTINGAAISPSPIAQQIQQNLRHMRIMASAGSGKTYRLTNRYLMLIRAGAEPESILASTFTRLAAGEIRDRILTALAELAEDEKKRAGLATDIGGPIDRDEAIEMLASLTQRLHRLQVRTLDSFFSAIVRAFALDLGMDPAAEIVDEQVMESLRQDAIRQMLDTTDENDAQQLLSTLSALVDELADRSATDSIDDVVRPLYDLYLEADDTAWDAVGELPGLLDAASRDRAMDEIERLAKGAAASSQIKGDFFAHKTVLRAFESDVDLVRTASLGSIGAWRGFLGSGISAKIAADEANYCRRAIPDDVRAAYEPFINHARALMRKVVVDRTQATRRLLERFHTHFDALKRQHKAMSFSDLTHALAHGKPRHGNAWAMDDVYFRLDATLRHLLLDEFQDTSIAQWRAMQPIVENVASNQTPDYSFFAVGDVKQSIYGWRGAVPEILENLPELLYGAGGEQAMETLLLPKSWRSSQIVIDAVNKLFESLPVATVLERYAEAVESWSEEFDPHTTAKTDQPGHVVLRTVTAAEEDQSQNHIRLREAAELSAKLYHEANGRDIKIGVLTRTNKAASHLLHELRGLDVPASVRGGGALTDAPAVNAILDLLRLADHPGHSVAAFNVMHSPLGEAVGMTDQGDRAANQRQWRNISRRVRRQVLENGYAATIAEWIGMIASAVDERQRRRLILLQDQAVHYDRRATLRCDDFVDYIESLDVADPFASSVQVMTVHQSKGLQFDAVVLPDMDNALCRMKLKVLIERDGAAGAAGPITRIARHVDNATTGLFPDLSKMLDHHEHQQVREALSLLYVAVTRAKNALYMLINPPKVNKDGSYSRSVSFAAVLREALAERDADPEEVLYVRGKADWVSRLPIAQTEASYAGSEDAVGEILLDRASGDVPRGRAAVVASALHSDEEERDDSHAIIERPLREHFMLHHGAARDRGSVIHAMFEQIGWIEDGVPGEDELRTIAQRIAPRRDVKWTDKQVQDFLAMIEKPAVRSALCRPEDDVKISARLYAEFPYARIVDGAIQRGYIDRLAVLRRGETPISAKILDYKTDDVAASLVAERAQRYRRQLETYRTVVSEMFALERDAISMQLLFTMPGEMVTVE